MLNDMIRALILPFDRDLLELPARAFVMRAEASEAWDTEWRRLLVAEQSFKPAYDALARQGFTATPRLEGTFPAGFVLMTKHKAENRANLARAWSLLEDGGVLVCCGANALGAASFEREVEKAVALDGKLSKHQSRVFWLTRRGDAPAILAEWADAARPRIVEGTALVARAGCFSPDRVDAGSRILAERFTAAIAGRVADLGAGWGYLASKLLDNPAVTLVDLYEAEALALEDARTNLPTERAVFHWHDVAAGMPEVEPYDWVVSNPPFHEGMRADPGIGQAFIQAAWKIIRRRGKFLLVANRHLPYEAELRKRFRDVEQVYEGEGYKVYLSSNRHDR